MPSASLMHGSPKSWASWSGMSWSLSRAFSKLRHLSSSVTPWLRTCRENTWRKTKKKLDLFCLVAQKSTTSLEDIYSDVDQWAWLNYSDRRWALQLFVWGCRLQNPQCGASDVALPGNNKCSEWVKVLYRFPRQPQCSQCSALTCVNSRNRTVLIWTPISEPAGAPHSSEHYRFCNQFCIVMVKLKGACSTVRLKRMQKVDLRRGCFI